MRKDYTREQPISEARGEIAMPYACVKMMLTGADGRGRSSLLRRAELGPAGAECGAVTEGSSWADPSPALVSGRFQQAGCNPAFHGDSRFSHDCVADRQVLYALQSGVEDVDIRVGTHAGTAAYYLWTHSAAQIDLDQASARVGYTTLTAHGTGASKPSPDLHPSTTSPTWEHVAIRSQPCVNVNNYFHY